MLWKNWGLTVRFQSAPHSTLWLAFLVVLFYLCPAHGSCAKQPADSEVAYGPLPAQKLILCRPQTTGSRSPGVLLLHGGGWIAGTAAGLKIWCDLFARHGFVAATVDYRLAGDKAHWPAQREDAELALQWLRAHSDEIGLDGNHICAYGESAGGHIALGLGGPEDKLACIVDAFGPTDLTALTGPAYQRSFIALVGEEDATWQQRLRAASPLFNLKPGFPPVLIVHGESDELIPPEQSTALMDALRRQKTPVMAIMYRGGHSWSHVSALDSASIMNHIILFMKTATER